MFCFFPQTPLAQETFRPCCVLMFAGRLEGTPFDSGVGTCLMCSWGERRDHSKVQCAIRIAMFPGSEMGNTGPSLHLMYEYGTMGDIDGPAVDCVKIREHCVPLVGLNLGASRGVFRRYGR